jgi:RNA polymerase sigma-70 factor (ECF subfamily)
MDSFDQKQREELLRSAVLAGDENAWRTWYQECFDDLYRYVRWRCAGRRDWADEIVQETWLTAVRRIRRFKPQQGPFLAWLRGIAANLLRNDLRKRRRQPTFQLAEEAPIAASTAVEAVAMNRQQEMDRQQERRQREERVAAALDALAEREEAVLRAKYLEGLSVAQIAANHGDTPKAVESLLTRARQAFRKVYRMQEE